MRRLKIETTDDNGGVGDEASAYPERPGEPDCIYYLRTGTCGYGTKCRFNHPCNAGGQVNTEPNMFIFLLLVHGVTTITELPQRIGQPDCGGSVNMPKLAIYISIFLLYYLKTGTCKYGSTVENHHPKYSQAHNLKDSKDESSSVLLNILGLPICQDGKSCPYYMRTGSCKYGYACKFHHPQPTSTANALPVVGTRLWFGWLCSSVFC